MGRRLGALMIRALRNAVASTAGNETTADLVVEDYVGEIRHGLHLRLASTGFWSGGSIQLDFCSGTCLRRQTRRSCRSFIAGRR